MYLISNEILYKLFISCIEVHNTFQNTARLIYKHLDELQLIFLTFTIDL